jgi:cytoskeletal protein CcmA (bactofilin family)
MILKKKDTDKEEAMFGKEGESMTGEGTMNSIIGKGCTVKGTVEVKNGTDGKVKAEITVKSAVVGGHVTGNIDAKDKIELQSGSRLQGDIKTSRLVIDEGVFFEGACKMSPEQKGDSFKPFAAAKTEEEKKEAYQPAQK